MDVIPAKVLETLKTYNLTPTVFEDPSASATVSQAAQSFGVTPGQIAKSILIKDTHGKFSMFVVAGDKRLSNKKLKEYLGSRGSMASPEETLAVTGFPVGGVCPFGLDTGELPIYIDQSLQPYPTVYPACGTRNSGVPTNYNTLLLMADGRTSDVTE